MVFIKSQLTDADGVIVSFIVFELIADWVSEKANESFFGRGYII